tara:strand:+ start:403 stop:1185 length:783 start_codon:yes stop_codon:yes gene_type:complete
MARKKRKKNIFWIYPLSILVLLSVFFSGIYVQTFFPVVKFQEEFETVQVEEVFLGENIAYVNVPAINQEGDGVSTKLIVKAEEGTGKTLVDINSLLYWVDTQNSIRMAKVVAKNYTGYNLNNYDLTFSVDANASLIGGESAGAALSLATIAAIQNLELKDSVMITGTINHDGSIGPIGGILEKAKAAKDVGSTLFLVPLLQSTEITYETNEHCETFGLMEWCTVEKIPVQVDINSEVGIDVVEVGNIKEALEYFVEEQTI